MSELDFPEIPTSELWIKFHEGEARERLEAAAEISDRLKNERNWVELIAVSEAALELPACADDIHMQGFFNFKIGYGNYSLNRFSDSIVSYRKSKSLFLEAGDVRYAIIALRNGAEALLGQKMFAEALELCDEAISVGDSEGLNYLHGDLYSRKADAYYELGLLDEALNSFEIARSNYQWQDNDEGMVQTDRQRIEVLLLTGRAAEAVELSERLLVLARHTADPVDLYNAVEVLARCLNQAGRPGQVLTLLDECEPSFNNVIRAREKAGLKSERAHALLELEHYEAAYETLREAVVLAEFSNNLQFQIELLKKAYNIAADFDDYRRMRPVAEEAVRVAKRAGSLQDRYTAGLRLMNLAILEGNYAAANEQLNAIAQLQVPDDEVSPDLHAEFAAASAELWFAWANHLNALDEAEKGLFILNGQNLTKTKARLLRIRALSLRALERINDFELPMTYALAAAIQMEMWGNAAEIAALMPPPNHLDIQLELNF